MGATTKWRVLSRIWTPCGVVLCVAAFSPGLAQDSKLIRKEVRDYLVNVAEAARQRQLEQPTNTMAKWEFARAVFNLAEHSTNNTERAELAVQGIGACRELIRLDPTSAPGHYYLGMNLGQLARTKLLGALKLVDEMEKEFKIARELDPKLDYAGPDRNLGQLYYEAPGWPTSIGSRRKARQHMQRAAELEPAYPDNWLIWIEACLKWDEMREARRHLEELEKNIPAARTNLSGLEWKALWLDWEKRLNAARKKAAPD